MVRISTNGQLTVSLSIPPWAMRLTRPSRPWQTLSLRRPCRRPCDVRLLQRLAEQAQAAAPLEGGQQQPHRLLRGRGGAGHRRSTAPAAAGAAGSPRPACADRAVDSGDERHQQRIVEPSWRRRRTPGTPALSAPTAIPSGTRLVRAKRVGNANSALGVECKRLSRAQRDGLHLETVEAAASASRAPPSAPSRCCRRRGSLSVRRQRGGRVGTRAGGTCGSSA